MATTIVPPAAPTEARTVTPTFRVTKSEDTRIKRAAKKAGHPPAVFMRLAVLAAVESSEKADAEARGKKAGR